MEVSQRQTAAAVAAPAPGSCATAAAAPAPGSSGAAGVPLGGAASSGSTAVSARRGPAAWLRHVILRNQSVAEEQRGAADPRGEDEEEVDDASDDGGSTQLADCASFGSLPEHLLEKIFGHLRGANRKHHFALCGVNRQWRRLGQAMFFSRPWEVAHLICHPTQLFCLSPRNVTGSRSGLLKCFVRRERGGPGGKRFTFHIGKDASQPQRSRFLMAAKHGGRDTVDLYMNSRCAGPPCARLRCNLFATQYRLTIADDLHLEPAAGTGSEAPPAGACPTHFRNVSRLTSWSLEAAAEAAAAAQHLQQQRLQTEERASSGGGGGGGQACQAHEGLGVDCFAQLQYQARVKGFMQPRRMRVVLPHASLLFYDQVLPQLSRRPSEAAQQSPGGAMLLSPPSGTLSSGGSVRRLSSTGSMAAAAAALAALGIAGTPEGSPLPRSSLTSRGSAGTAAGTGGTAGTAGTSGDSGRLRRLVRKVCQRRQLAGLLQPHRTVPLGGGEGGDSLQPAVLQNKAPHWNEGLRCWCLNFRGRVKLASVKNFQLVRADDPGERVVMQFGKAEQDAFILDFNPTVLTALQAFSIVLSTFDSKLLL